MGWEWRVFYQSPGLDLLSSLRPKARVSQDRRTDVYVVCSHRAGVKIRGHDDKMRGREGSYRLEVKLRASRQKIESRAKESRTEEGFLEEWKKERLDVRWDGRDGQRLATVASKYITEKRDKIAGPGSAPELSRAVQDVITLGALDDRDKKHDIQMITVFKRRTSWTFLGVSVEQTDITVDVQPGVMWRTVCMESSRRQDVEKALREQLVIDGKCKTLREHLLEGSGTTCGYPEFIAS